MRQSNTVTKVFDVEFVAGDTSAVEDDGLNFVSEVRASHVSLSTVCTHSGVVSVSSRCVIHVCLLSSVNACVVGFCATVLLK